MSGFPEPDEYPWPYPLDIAVGAWHEAIEADGIERIYLVLLVLLITVIVPTLFVLTVAHSLGVIA